MPKQKSMTVNEAVEFIRGLLPLWALMPAPEGLDPTMYGTGTTDGDNDVNKRLRAALAVLEGTRLCDEAEAREIIEHLYETAVTYDALGGCEVCHSARRWLAEHGGE